MTPWASHEALTTALGEQSCGCLLIEKAQKENDPYAKQALEEVGKTAQKSWGCHIGGYEPLQTLSPEQTSSLQAVSKLIKTDCLDCKTCPRADLYFSNAKGKGNIIAQDISRVVKLKTWRDKGQLNLIVGDNPTHTLMEALDAFDEATAVLQSYDIEKQKQKYEREREKYMENNNPTIKSKVVF